MNQVFAPFEADLTPLPRLAVSLHRGRPRPLHPPRPSLGAVLYQPDYIRKQLSDRFETQALARSCYCEYEIFPYCTGHDEARDIDNGGFFLLPAMSWTAVEQPLY